MAKLAAPKLPTNVGATFFTEVASELKKVTWPTKQQVYKLTATVIAVSAFVGFFIGGLDITFLKISSLLYK